MSLEMSKRHHPDLFLKWTWKMFRERFIFASGLLADTDSIFWEKVLADERGEQRGKAESRAAAVARPGWRSSPRGRLELHRTWSSPSLPRRSPLSPQRMGPLCRNHDYPDRSSAKSRGARISGCLIKCHTRRCVTVQGAMLHEVHDPPLGGGGGASSRTQPTAGEKAVPQGPPALKGTVHTQDGSRIQFTHFLVAPGKDCTREIGETGLAERPAPLGPALFPSSLLGTWAQGLNRRCGGGFCPHLGGPTCALGQWLLISSSAPGLQNPWTLRLPRGCGRFPGCPHCLWAAPITPTSLPTMKCPLRFSTQSRFPPTLHWGKAVKGFCKLFSRFQKAQRKSYTYLNEVPRLNKTLSLFALGWSHINSVW